MRIFFLANLVLIMLAFVIGCAGKATQLHMKDTVGVTKPVEFPKGTITGAASKEQATTLARIFVDSHNMAIGELAEIKATARKSVESEEELKRTARRIEEGIQKLDETSKKSLETSRSNLETAQKALQLLEELSKKQGTGEITIFFPVGVSILEKNSLEYERLVRFVDFLSRESKGRKVLLISIGSASAFGNKRFNEKLAQKRSEFPKDVIDKYLINIPHEFFKVYGTGDVYSPKNITMKEHQRYQHTRIIAFYETDQIPALPDEPVTTVK